MDQQHEGGAGQLAEPSGVFVRVEGVTRRFGEVAAVDDVWIAVGS